MGKLYGVHTVELKPGVTGEEVEQFARTLIAQMPPISGMRFALLKGDRGDHIGRYLWLIEFDSVEARDQLIPDSGPTEVMLEWFAVVTPMLEGWRQYVTAIPGPETPHTDYHDVTS
jgi:hypothetical protein